jgi:prepilin-type N-terminal cleavage/methylation domain-containing protein
MFFMSYLLAVKSKQRKRPLPPGLSDLPVRQAGFTLIEVMLAAVIMSIIALGASAYIVNSYRGMHLAKQRRTAIALAENTHELLINTAPSDFPSLNNNGSAYILLETNGVWRTGSSGEKHQGIQGTPGGPHGFFGQGSQGNQGSPGYLKKHGKDTSPAETVTIGNKTYHILTWIQKKKQNTASLNAFEYLNTTVTVAWDEYAVEIKSRCAL